MTPLGPDGIMLSVVNYVVVLFFSLPYLPWLRQQEMLPRLPAFFYCCGYVNVPEVSRSVGLSCLLIIAVLYYLCSF